MPETYGYGSSSAGTAGSRVVGSPECVRTVLDGVDDVDWSDGVYSCYREGDVVSNGKGIWKCVRIPPGRESCQFRWTGSRRIEWTDGKLVDEMITSGVQTLVVESDQEVRVNQEVSIVDVKNFLMSEFHSGGGSMSMPEELLVRASDAIAAIEKVVWEKQKCCEISRCEHWVGVQYHV